MASTETKLLYGAGIVLFGTIIYFVVKGATSSDTPQTAPVGAPQPQTDLSTGQQIGGAIGALLPGAVNAIRDATRKVASQGTAPGRVSATGKTGSYDDYGNRRTGDAASERA